MAFPTTDPTIWGTWPKASFAGVEFPVEQSSIKGGLRDHVHEYPHSPGGVGEKLGRKLYTFDVLIAFDTGFTNYPGNYPDDLDTLLRIFEQGLTDELRLPQMNAAIPVYAFSWTREQSARVRSGEKVRIEFREDQTQLFLFGNIVADGSSQIQQGGAALTTNLAALGVGTVPGVTPGTITITVSPATTSLFGSLQNAIGFVTALQGSALLFDQSLASSLQQVQNLCATIDAQPDMQVVAAYSVVETLHEIWAAAQQLQSDLLTQGAPLQQWTNTRTQDIGSIAIQLYGSTQYLSELLSLNPFPDNARVPAGAQVSYYPHAA